MKSSVFKERRKNLADLILNNELYVPMKTKEIAILLGIPKELRHELQEVLDSLVADGTIGVSKKGKYMKPDNVALVGTFESTSRGFGFVVVDGLRNGGKGYGEDLAVRGGDGFSAGVGEVFHHAGDVIADHVEAGVVQFFACGVGTAVEQVGAGPVVQLQAQGSVVLGGDGWFEADSAAADFLIALQQCFHLRSVRVAPGAHDQLHVFRH